MQIVVASHGARVRFRKGLLIVEDREDRKEYPLHQVDEVLLLTGGIAISTRALRALLRAGSTVAVFDWDGQLLGLFMPPAPHGTAAYRRCQYEAAANGKGLELARKWIWLKIRGQLENLKTWRRGLRDYSRYKAELDAAADAAARAQGSKELMEAEARAASAYWEAWRELLPGFPGRDQEGRDPVNMALNYGYGILKALCLKSLLLAGLDPYGGFLHVDKSGRPSLVLDFMEQFRPRVDRAVYKAARKGLRAEEGLLDHPSRRRVAEEVLEELGAPPKSPLSAEIHRAARATARSLC